MAPLAVVEWATPDSVVVWLRLAALGALGGTGHFLFILAYRLAPASTVAPFLYFQLIAMVTLGYVVFEDVPNLWQLAGALIVVGSGVYLFSSRANDARCFGLKAREASSHAADAVLTRLVVGGRRLLGHDVG